MFTSSGCVALDKYQREKSSRLRLEAEKEQLQIELADARSLNDALRQRVDALELGNRNTDEMLTSLRNERELLAEAQRRAREELERMADSQHLGELQIVGPRLPEPLNNALKEFAAQHPNEVVFDETTGVVKWKGDILFALGSDVVRDSALSALVSFCDIVKSPAAEGFDVLVVGHTDNIPIQKAETRARHETNWHLSAHRAIGVARAFQKNGVPANRVGVAGYGEYRPVADNGSDAGRSQNRRVEIYLVPSGTVSTIAAGS